jgi:nucleotide-binding universal stress UspA family protein
MYKRILVAIDGSETSKLALDHALQLAKEQHARLRIAHVVEAVGKSIPLMGGYPFDAAALQQTLRDDGKELLAATAANLRGQIDAETALLEAQDTTERTAAVLAREAQRWEADLIAVGTHGRRGFDRMFLGSVAESLIRVAPAPVLLVRGKAG